VVLAAALFHNRASSQPPQFEHQDKAGHFVLFGLETFLSLLYAHLSARHRTGDRQKIYISYANLLNSHRVVLLFLCLLAFASEGVQACFLSNRTGTIGDIAANIIGILAGFTIFVKHHQWKAGKTPLSG
jgi:VanZ family protein